MTIPTRGVPPRRRFFLACAIGALAATLVFTWVLLEGRADLLSSEGMGAFYDAQARSLLHGHWDVPATAASFERFEIDGRYYMYFGPWPAVLRMPILALSDGFDGRLSRVSMLLAYLVLLCSTSVIAWRARVAVRGEGPVGRRTLVAAGGFVALVGCGSTALFLGARAWVYHEAILWATALSMAAFAFLLAYLRSGRGAHLALAAGAATLALLSRPSVALGPVVAIGALLLVRLVQQLHDRAGRSSRLEGGGRAWPARVLGVGRDTARGPAWVLLVAIAVPLVLYVYVNQAKFGSALGLPYEKQDLLFENTPERRAALAATGNSLVGLEYVPTNLLQYLRPDAIGLRDVFPWITFSGRPTIVGDVALDPLEPSASVTATSILLLALAAIGLVSVLRRTRDRRSDDGGGEAESSPEEFRLPVLGAAIAAAATTVVASQAFRYESDFLPLLVMLGALGLFAVGSSLEGRSARARRVVEIGMVVLAAWSCWAVFSLSLIYQREFSPFQEQALRTGFVSFQLDVNEALGLGPPSFERGSELPVHPGKEFRRADAPHGQLFVVGDCEGLFLATGRAWEPVEERLPGLRRWRVRFGEPAAGVRQPLWSAGAGPSQVLWAEWVDDRHVRFEFETGGAAPVVTGDRVLEVEPGRAYDLDVRFDPTSRSVAVGSGDEVLLLTPPDTFSKAERSRLGEQPDPARGATKFSGSVDERSLTPICDRLLTA